MKTQELNLVSSPAAAWLEKLESSSFLTPAQISAVTHLECGGKRSATPLFVRPTALSNPKSRSTVGMISTSSHNFPLIPGNSRLFPLIPSYFPRARGTQTMKYKDIMKRKSSCGVPIQKISPNLHVIHFAFCILKSAFQRGLFPVSDICILHSKICNSGGFIPDICHFALCI
jgi:hypothetical protein